MYHIKPTIYLKGIMIIFNYSILILFYLSAKNRISFNVSLTVNI